MPIGVVAGNPKWVMKLHFSGADDGSPVIFAGGTFNGHPLSTMVAGTCDS